MNFQRNSQISHHQNLIGYNVQEYENNFGQHSSPVRSSKHLNASTKDGSLKNRRTLRNPSLIQGEDYSLQQPLQYRQNNDLYRISTTNYQQNYFNTDRSSPNRQRLSNKPEQLFYDKKYLYYQDPGIRYNGSTKAPYQNNKCEQQSEKKQQKILDLNKASHCPEHQIPYDLLGNNKLCKESSLICCHCLKTDEHNHKINGINHESISIFQLRSCFSKNYIYYAKQIQHAQTILENYVNMIKQRLLRQINRQYKRLQQFIFDIPLTEISKQPQQLSILQKLRRLDLQSVKCNDVASIAQKLFSFQPTKISAGFSIFQQIVKQNYSVMEQKIEKILNSVDYTALTLKNIRVESDYPRFKEQIKIEDLPVNQAQNSYVQQKVQQSTKAHKSLPKPSFRIKPEQTKSKSITKFVKNNKIRQQSLINLKIPRRNIQFIGSAILVHRQDDQFVDKMFQNSKPVNAKLLFRASEHNFSVKTFHQLCDGESNTIVFLKTQFKKVIGGFSSIAWKSSNNTMHSDIKKQCFLFSVTLKQKMSLIDPQKAIFNSISQGPTFGAGADLSICNNANMKRLSYSNFPYSYQNSKYKQNSQHSTFLLTGQSSGCHFYILQWEVWKINFINQ